MCSTTNSADVNKNSWIHECKINPFCYIIHSAKPPANVSTCGLKVTMRVSLFCCKNSVAHYGWDKVISWQDTIQTRFHSTARIWHVNKEWKYNPSAEKWRTCAKGKKHLLTSVNTLCQVHKKFYAFQCCQISISCDNQIIHYIACWFKIAHCHKSWLSQKMGFHILKNFRLFPLLNAMIALQLMSANVLPKCGQRVVLTVK